jgi:phosphoglycolate phosphatase
MNTNEIYDEALTSTTQKFKPELSGKALEQLMSRTRGKTFTNQLQLILGKTHPRFNAAIRHYEEYLHSDGVYVRISLLENAEDLLRGLKHKGHVLALATGMNPSLLARLFHDGTLPSDIFEQVASIHDISDPELQKPHPKVLLDLLKNLKLTPKEAAYVGDTCDDVEMAKRCGMLSVAVLTGRLRKRQSQATGADLVLESVLELPKWI